MSKIAVVGVSQKTVKLFVTVAWLADYTYTVYRLKINGVEIGWVGKNRTTKKWYWSVECKLLNIPIAYSDKEYIRAGDARRGAMRYVNTFLDDTE